MVFDSGSARLLMVDRGAEVLDRDAAFAVTEAPGGSGWCLEVHIAGVADVVAPGSDVDATAFLRRESKYFPTRTVPMLGRATELAATLTPTADRSTLRVRAELSRDGVISAAKVDRGWVPTGRCVAVEHSDVARIHGSVDDPLSDDVRLANAAVQALLSRRRRAGALTLYDIADGWVSTEEGSITAIPLDARTVGYVIVQVLMIAANEAIAQWCAQENLPILYQNHNRPAATDTGDDLAAEVEEAMADPVRFEKLRFRLCSTCLAATYAPIVDGHHGLRLAAYTHATAPLRRVADLITQRVIFAHLDGAPAPYTAAQLGNLASDINRRIAADQKAETDRIEARDRMVTAHIAADGGLAGLDAKRWTKVLAAATEGDLVDEVAAELMRRMHLFEVPAQNIVSLLDAGAQWIPIRRKVFDWAAHAHPEFGPAVLAMWSQAHPEVPWAEIDGDQIGLSHAMRFAARYRVGDIYGPWAVAGSKKRAEQDAAWGLIIALTEGSHGDVESPLSQSPAAASAAAAYGR